MPIGQAIWPIGRFGRAGPRPNLTAMISYLSAVQKYAVFHGRARRLEFWMFTLVNIVITIALQVAVKSHVPYLVYSLAVILPTLAVTVRRLHDTSHSAWWLLIGVVPIVGQIVLFVFLLARGDDGVNQYGQDPKAASAR
jgi:uncharacterized membrane protein YhaH (DUF805 family)